ncbi:MAG: hypothetical protein AB7F59_12780 [Bdellovibrionales bacterium]
MSKTLSKRLISVLLVFHLLVIGIFPVASSYLWTFFSPLMIPYANALGINSSWQFFAPEPETWIYLEYEIEHEEVADDLARSSLHKWPPPRKIPFDLLYTWHSSMKAFAFTFPQQLPLTLGRWMCRQHPEAFSITFRRVTLQIPTFQNVVDGQKIIEENSMIADLGSIVCSDVRELHQETESL